MIPSRVWTLTRESPFLNYLPYLKGTGRRPAQEYGGTREPVRTAGD